MRTEDELARLAALHDLHPTNGTVRPELDTLAGLAAYVCGGTAQAVVSLVDEAHQRVVAGTIRAADPVARRDSMCEPTIEAGTFIHVADASTDDRYRAKPYVDGRLGEIRFYASVPLMVSGHAVGSLCAFDTTPRQLDDQQADRFQDLGGVAASLLELRGNAVALTREVTIDALTGIANRSIFDNALERFYSRGERGFTRPGVIFVDVNDFKQVNDVHGHHAGDEVLRQTARRLLATVRAADLVIRMGGDEFVVLIDEAPSLEEATLGIENLASRIRAVLAQPFVIGADLELRLSAAVGSALVGVESDGPAGLVHRADVAMYADKRAARQVG